MIRKSYWVFDDEVLSTPYSDVVYRASGWNIPGRDGENLKNSNSDGTTWQPFKPFEQKIVPLSLWVTGFTTDPTLDSATALEDRIDWFTRLFGRSGDLYKLERRHYLDGAVNRITNPRFDPALVTARATGITKLASAAYTAPAGGGYIGFELPAGTSASLTLDGVAYNYTDLKVPIAGWVYLDGGKTSAGTLPTGANVYFYNPATANHTQVANLFPLPRAVEQWQPMSWNGGSVLAITPDGSGKLMMSTPLGGKYVYPVTGASITPEEQILSATVTETLAPVYLAEVSYRFPADLKLEGIPSKLFGDIIFTSASATHINAPTGNLTLVPTARGFVLPALGASMTYDTAGWKYPGSNEWVEHFYGSGVVHYEGEPPITVVDPLSTGETQYHGAQWHDADFGPAGQTVWVTFKNSVSHIVSPTVVTHAAVYTHPEPLKLLPAYYDGDSPNTSWVGTPQASESVLHTTRWIEVECPTDGVDFQSQAGGTRATFDLELAAPGVYWRDKVSVTQEFSWTQPPSWSGNYTAWTLDKFKGGTGPLGGLKLEVYAGCTQTNWDVELEVYDVATRRTTTLKFPVNETWLLDAEKFLFYQIAPVQSIDRYASVARVSRSFGGDLITVHPDKTGVPILNFRTPEYEIPTINFEVRLSGHRRYLSA